LPDELFFIEPLTSGFHSSFDGRHVIYKSSDVKESGITRKCGNEKDVPNAKKIMNHFQKFSGEISKDCRVLKIVIITFFN